MATKGSRSEAQIKASEKWEGKFKRRIIRISPEKDAALIARAKNNGESVNSLMNRLIDEELEN